LAAVLAGTALLLGLMPRTYRVETKLLALPDPVLSALANPGRAVVPEDPSRFAAEAVRKRSHLDRLVDETGLMESWPAHRAPLLRLKDRTLEALGRRPSPKDRKEALVDLLEKRLYVHAEDGTVVIGVEWPDGPMARAIVEAAQGIFLEERRGMEVASVEDGIAILERHLAETDPAAFAGPVALRTGAADRHERLSRRLWDAHIELDGARTAFDRRYGVVEPTRTPRKPERPDVAGVLAAGALAGLLLGAFTAGATDLRARRPGQEGGLPRGAFAALLAVLTLATVGAAVAGNGSIAVATAPVLGVAVLYGLATAPVRVSALVVLFLVLALENPGDAGGPWRSPLAPLGTLLLANLNLTIPVRALRFSGVDVLIGILLGVILCRRAVRSSVDRADVPTARPMTWSVAIWLATVLLLWAWGLARGGDFRNSLWQSHQLVLLPLIYFVFQRALRGPRDFGALARVVVAAACLKAGLALWVRLTVSADASVLATATSHGDSVLFASAFALVATLVLEEAVSGRRRLAAGLILALLAAGMHANNRRLAWVEVAAALAALFVVASTTRVKRALTRAAMLSLPLLAVYAAVGWTSASPVFKPLRLARSLVEPKTDFSTAMRDIENFNLLWTLRDHPLMGTGFGHEYVEKVRGMDIASIFAQYRFVPHNSVLGLLAFGGLLGLSGVFLALVVGVFLAARAHHFARSPGERAAALAVIATVVVYLIQSYGDMGLMSWAGLFVLAPALVVAAKLATATGAWPVAPGDQGAVVASAADLRRKVSK
jgi:hypothetical protein